jgi:hypothetical protein
MNSTHPGRDTLAEVTDQTVVTSNQAAGAASHSRNRTAHQVSALKLRTSDCAKDSNIPENPTPRRAPEQACGQASDAQPSQYSQGRVSRVSVSFP